jgi:dTDP-4-amino-4,6-dideoxygalactose transaminase
MSPTYVKTTLALAHLLPSVAGMAVSPNRAAQTSAAAASGISDIKGPTFSKALSTPDAVPQAGQLRALELMNSGALFRYTPGVLSETALAEEAMCDYAGFKYSVGFNSCGSALFIALKCAGVQPGDKVLCNAFSFTAVPSAIHHAFALPTYVESTDGFVMDMDDLEAKILENPDAKYLMLTHMRGKVADMQRAYEIAAKHDITVVEDCAHALGIKYDGVQLGTYGNALAACFSSQSAKMINSGEGGFLCTDDEEIAAKAICYAGCYESLVEQHLVKPSREVFDAVKKETPNYSLRMSDLTAACIQPQIANLEERIAKYNGRYERLCSQLAACDFFHVPELDPRVRPASDSLQINLRGMSAEQVNTFLGHCKRRGMPVGLFGSVDNARNFRNWQYSPIATGVESTEEMIKAAIDVRLPLSFEEADFDQMGKVLLAALDDTLA